MKANTMPNRISQGSHIPCIHEGALVYVYDNEGSVVYDPLLTHVNGMIVYKGV